MSSDREDDGIERSERAEQAFPDVLQQRFAGERMERFTREATGTPAGRE